jgi:CHASE3 domain sensor protein
MKFSFNGKFGVVVGLGLLAFISIGVLLYESVAPVINAVETRRSSESILMHLDGMLSGLRDLETSEREYVLTGRMNYRDSSQAAVNKIQQETAALKMLTVTYQEQQRRFALLEFQIVKRLEYSHQLIGVLEKQGRTSAKKMALTGGDGEIAENIENTISDMRNAQDELLKQQDRLINPRIRMSVTLIVISYLAAILIVFLFGAVALRESRLRRWAEEMRKRLSLTVDQATDLVVITDLTGKIEYVNRAVEETTGYAAKELLGKSRDLWYSGKHDAEFFQKKRDTVRSGGTFQATVTYGKRTATSSISSTR